MKNSPFIAWFKTLRASKIRIGPIGAEGVPAILLGAAGIVVAAGAMRAIAVGAPNLPETLRELRGLIESTRNEPKKLQA